MVKDCKSGDKKIWDKEEKENAERRKEYGKEIKAENPRTCDASEVGLLSVWFIAECTKSYL